MQLDILGCARDTASQDFELYLLPSMATGLRGGYSKNPTGSYRFSCACYSVRTSSLFSLPDLAPDFIIINIPTLDYKKYISSRTTSFRVRFPLKVTALGGGRRSADSVGYGRSLWEVGAVLYTSTDGSNCIQCLIH